MGSVAEDETTVNVLITGFAPFKEDYPVNPSWEIAKSLPEYLPPIRAKTTTTARPPVTIPPVRLHVHPEAVHVGYTAVRELVPKLWEDPSKYDVAIHIGMAGPRLHHSIERRGHRDGYNGLDVDGNRLNDDERREREGKDWVWDGCPEELLSDFDLEDVLVRWRANSPKWSDLRISEDAGHYLCDFIYYSSLAHLYRLGERRKVVFLHVPCDAGERAVEAGRELLLQLVRSIVESETARKEREKKEQARKDL
ncbi:Pyroglutamyl-peptidase 1 [Podospora australis]|uniref:Pyroglutamyl-peptidase 1 n=1 Tax=Podospora australis TaxID=1536484 RepID=A0AAN6X637_9PEZI|nr:Pyroglutamyl-peptidase 1 [Podospora australis]